MLIQLSDKHRIVSNPCGGYDMQVADFDKKTGEQRMRNGKPVWKFLWYMPTLAKMLREYIEELTPVAGTVEGIQAIINTIECEYEKLKLTLRETWDSREDE